MHKFEYKITLLRMPESPTEIDKQIAKLDEYGREGWELVALTPAAEHRLFYFKRALRSK